MKKGSFAGFLYREYYLGRQSYITGLLSFAAFVLLGWLALLSMKCGNFALLFGDEASGSTGILKDKEAAALIHMLILRGIKYMPLVTAFTFSFSSVEISAKDTLNSWIRFEHCTPVTPFRYAAVKVISTAIVAAVSFILALSYLFSVTAALGEKFTYGDFSIIVLFLTVLIVFGILSQISITLLRSRDMGMILSMLVVAVPVFIISGKGAMKTREKNDIESGDPLGIDIVMSELTDKAQELCPIMLTVLIGSFVLLFVSMYLLYKRREK